MSIRERLSGNEAIAYAMRQIDPDVFAAFPITPSTEIPQYFAQYVANGLHVHLRGGRRRRCKGGHRHLLLRPGLHV